jgi:RNA-directed DNA polymerase
MTPPTSTRLPAAERRQALINNYYGRFYRTALDPLLKRLNAYLRPWAARKYKRLRTEKRFRTWWTGLLARQPALFVHWRTVRTSYG